MSYEQAREQAEYEGRPILVYFGNINDANARVMEVRVFPRDDVMPLLSQFVTVRLETFFVSIRSLSQGQRQMVGEQNLDLQFSLTGETAEPSFVVLNERGEVLATLFGQHKADEFAAFLTRALATYRQGGGPKALRLW